MKFENSVNEQAYKTYDSDEAKVINESENKRHI
jgi:hypothetical protein